MRSSSTENELVGDDRENQVYKCTPITIGINMKHTGANEELPCAEVPVLLVSRRLTLIV